MVIIEDNPADLYIVTEVIKQCEFEVEIHIATDGEMALSLLERLEIGDHHAPIIALLDLNLPKISGTEVLAYIRGSDRYRNIPVVITTSSDAPADLGAIAQSGATAYFRKPTNLDKYFELKEVIAAVIGSPPPRRSGV